MTLPPSHRIFTGPDGKEYRWKLANTKPVVCITSSRYLLSTQAAPQFQLYTNDDTNTHVAKFHQKDIISITPNAKRATLEIYPAGEHMVDLIVVSLVYVEKLRRDRERAAHSGGGGGGGDGGGG